MRSLWCQQELKRHVILDLGCAKSVVGVAWINDVISEWQKHGHWFRVFPEKEIFQFGSGQSLASKYSVHFEVMIVGCGG